MKFLSEIFVPVVISYIKEIVACILENGISFLCDITFKILPYLLIFLL